MKCLHCGYCCIMLDVIIINPEFEEEVTNDFIKTLNEFDDDKYYYHKKCDTPCPYLQFNNGKYLCSIHDKLWYKFTPCYSYDQISSNKENDCRIGDQIITGTNTGNKMKIHLKEIFKGDKNVRI